MVFVIDSARDKTIQEDITKLATEMKNEAPGKEWCDKLLELRDKAQRAGMPLVANYLYTIWHSARCAEPAMVKLTLHLLATVD